MHQDVSNVRLHAETAECNPSFQTQDSPSSYPMNVELSCTLCEVMSTWDKVPGYKKSSGFSEINSTVGKWFEKNV